MPANKKYLTTSNWAKAGKLSAAIFGGFLAVIAMELALASVFDTALIMGISIVTTFILWGFFILYVYWVRVAWKAWLTTFGIILLSAMIIFLTKIWIKQ